MCYAPLSSVTFSNLSECKTNVNVTNRPVRPEGACRIMSADLCRPARNSWPYITKYLFITFK